MKDITTENKTNIQNSIGRLVATGLSFFIQLIWLVYLGIRLTKYSAIINIVTSIIALLFAMWVFDRRDTNVNFRLPWIMLILAFPIVGIVMFVLFGHKYQRRYRAGLDEIHRKCASQITFNSIDADEIGADEIDADEIAAVDKGVINQFRYLSKTEGYPLFRSEAVKYYPEACDAYDELIECVKNAKYYIFMEYHAIQDSDAFARLHSVLVEKAKIGVDVRILYDDIGSIGFLNEKFAKKLNSEGIKCKAFNKVSPAFRWYMNNRDHRKITVIDGETAFTGGYNIANEYFNITHPFGKWKDTGLMIKGEAVNSFLCMFMEMWNMDEKDVEDFTGLVHKTEIFQKTCETALTGKTAHIEKTNRTGFILPYADCPIDESRIGENVYLNLISNAKDSCYIITPYLVISDEMQKTLQLAALRGVDVRIITPGIPDKKVIYRLTRSYYEMLIKAGVKIYEYTPGFPHCKMFVVDGELAVVGTINLDYRSLFHHFENAVLMYKNDAVNDIKKDFDEIFSVSEFINPVFSERHKLGREFLDCCLRLIAPLL